MRRIFLFLILLGSATSIAACSAAPVPNSVPAAAPVAPTQVTVVASPTVSNPPTQIVTTDVPSTILPTATNAPAQAANTGSDAQACATDNHAPLDAFRSDSPEKLTASAKPKFVEFYAVW